jgi:AraC-like DNA-binding protein
MLERYLKNLSVDVEPFAVCMVDNYWRLTLPGPPIAMLHFIVQGEGWVKAPGLPRTHISPNYLIVIPHGAIHSLEAGFEVNDELTIDCAPSGPPIHHIQAGDGSDLELVVGCGTLKVHYGEAFGLFDHLHQTLVVDLSSVPEVPILYQGLLAEQASGQPGGPVLQGAIMTQLLVHMFRKLHETHDTSLTWLTALDDPRLAAALDAIMEDPGAHHTVDSLSDTAHMSRSAFAKAFQEAFHDSPINLLKHIRMEQAAKLLSCGNLPVERVAAKLGYSSRSHFSHAFKKHTGQTPAEFRQV